jgi:hypothetical protein
LAFHALAVARAAHNWRRALLPTTFSLALPPHGRRAWITGAAQIEERHDRLLHLMQSLDAFPDERIVDRGRIAVHKVVASGLHLPEMCRDPPMAEGRQVGSSVVPNSKG